MRRGLLEIAVGLAAAVLSVNAGSLGVAISQPTLRLIPGVPAAGYFTITNTSDGPLVLSGAQSPDCGTVMLHLSSTTGGMARMEDVTSVTIPRGQSLSFAPGGYHLMCMNPSPRLHVGGKARIILKFGNGFSSNVDFTVVNARGRQ
jgi:copper(I)-binding protein